MNHINIEKASECCGCGACSNICPQNAIKMVENEEGFKYPTIDESKCIDCGLCKKVCPWLNENSREDYMPDPVCYAAKSLNKDIQKKSSSGGLFSVLATKVIEKNGIVVGCELDSNHKAHHIIVKNEEELYKLRGSKYIASDLGNVFIEVRSELQQGKLVLFSGVPCQVSALLSFLQKKYDNLITVEIICHGTPSQKSFDKYVEYLEKKNNAKLVNYSFRSKEAACWGTYKALAEFEEGEQNNTKKIIKKINADFDPYYSSFLKCQNHRESCYECKYAKSDRNADVTLGDFWGIEHIKPDMIDYDGVSAICINTLKGKNLFELIKEKIEYTLVDYNDVKKHNHQLKLPSKRPEERNNWYQNIDENNFFKNIKVRKSIKLIVKNMVPQKMKLRIKQYIKK